MKCTHVRARLKPHMCVRRGGRVQIRWRLMAAQDEDNMDGRNAKKSKPSEWEGANQAEGYGG